MDAKGQYMIDRYRFAYVGSGRDLLSSRSKPSAPGLELVLIANPDFDAGKTDSTAAVTTENSASSENRFRPLPGTATEAELIPPLVAGTGAKRVLLGQAATEAAVRQAANPRILHIATHGFFLEQNDLGVEKNGYEHALVKSGLALAGANRRNSLDSTNDGLLTALEVSGIDLSATELVVLSTCDSGAGSSHSGPRYYRFATRALR